MVQEQAGISIPPLQIENPKDPCLPTRTSSSVVDLNDGYKVINSEDEFDKDVHT